MSSFVLDASVTLSWLLDDEGDPAAVAALNQLEDGDAHVPTLWHMEVRNALLMAVKRGRMTEHQVRSRLHDLANLPIITDHEPDFDIALGMGFKCGLTVYDALYLELAQRKHLPLITLDQKLAAAFRDFCTTLP